MVTSALALRRLGLPPRPRLDATAWPAYIAVLLLCIALVPLFRSGFATVIGSGSDAHLAAGTAEFLKHARPGTVDASLPVDQVPLVWRSKPPIYYAFAAVSSLSGLETYEVLSVLGALLLTLAAVGWFVFAREVLGAERGDGGGGDGDRRADPDGRPHRHPPLLQPDLGLPGGAVRAHAVVVGRAPPVGRRDRPAGAVHARVRVRVSAGAADPGAGPRGDVGHRAPAGRQAVLGAVKPAWRRLRAQPRRFRWPLYGLLVLLVLPLFGVWEKLDGGLRMLIDTNYSLRAWGGDLQTWYPERQFFAIHAETRLVDRARRDRRASRCASCGGCRGRRASGCWR